jgi:hypothetical protein
MSWAAAASVGLSLASGALGSDAAEGAAGSANAGLQAAADELKSADRRTRGDTNVYRNYGAGSTAKLSYLMGVGTPTYNQYSGQTLVDRASDGTIQPNSLLYSTDPAYKRAFNQLKQRIDNNEGFATNSTNIDGYAETFLRNSLGANNTQNSAQPDEYGSLLRDFSQQDLDDDVVYNTGLDFGLSEGNKAIERNATRFGNLDSGATLKALARYGNDYGSQKAGDAYGRFMNDKNFTLGSLTGAAGIGQNAVNTSAQSGLAVGQGIADTLADQGANNAAADIGSANAWSDTIGSVAGEVGGLIRGGSFNFGNLFGKNKIGGATNAVPGAYYV